MAYHSQCDTCQESKEKPIIHSVICDTKSKDIESWLVNDDRQWPIIPSVQESRREAVKRKMVEADRHGPIIHSVIQDLGDLGEKPFVYCVIVYTKSKDTESW